ncbi:hypothetical protein [Nostoc sp.]
MSTAVPLRRMWFKYMKTAVSFVTGIERKVEPVRWAPVMHIA